MYLIYMVYSAKCWLNSMICLYTMDLHMGLKKIIIVPAVNFITLAFSVNLFESLSKKCLSD